MLRYDTVADAHNAVTDAWRLFHECPTPRKVETDQWGLPRWETSVAPETSTSPTSVRGSPRPATPGCCGTTAQPVAIYSLRVARRQNVVVVVETNESDDPAEFT